MGGGLAPTPADRHLKQCLSTNSGRDLEAKLSEGPSGGTAAGVTRIPLLSALPRVTTSTR